MMSQILFPPPFFSIQISLFSCIVLLSSENKPVNVWKNLSGFHSAQPSILNRACSWLFQKEPSHQAAEICPTLTFLCSRKTYTIRRKSSLESQLAHLQLRSILTYRSSLVRSATAFCRCSINAKVQSPWLQMGSAKDLASSNYSVYHRCRYGADDNVNLQTCD